MIKNKSFSTILVIIFLLNLLGLSLIILDKNKSLYPTFFTRKPVEIDIFLDKNYVEPIKQKYANNSEINIQFGEFLATNNTYSIGGTSPASFEFRKDQLEIKQGIYFIETTNKPLTLKLYNENFILDVNTLIIVNYSTKELYIVRGEINFGDQKITSGKLMEVSNLTMKKIDLDYFLNQAKNTKFKQFLNSMAVAN